MTDPVAHIVLFFIYRLRPPPTSPLFPYTTLFRSVTRHLGTPVLEPGFDGPELDHVAMFHGMRAMNLDVVHERDRKSTRLNSSHVAISYAVFCLKKKKKLRQSLHDSYHQVSTGSHV